MSHQSDSRHLMDSCLLQLHSWRPLHFQTSTSKTIDSEPHLSANRRPHHYSSNGMHSKRPCLSDRATAPFTLDAIDMSRLTLFDADKPIGADRYKIGSYSLIARKKRGRRGSRSVSGRSSDRSGTRRCCSVGASAAHGTCSDFPVAMETDSSGELFGNGDANWSLDMSEAKNSKRDKERDGGSAEKENLGIGFGASGVSDVNGNESGYESEPGYRGDAEVGYGDEPDEEDDDARMLFCGDQLAAAAHSKVETAGEKNTLLDQKSHHRCRRRKHDCRMADALK
ncbi:uncharacterized protein LOC114728463 [Neltuma alba]|uniref:uncharacterized protein LOC114728463 n=1 Tax=Neltuma alba TaxID=207710 RepID=UPI0010A4867D|nr:uncharacterized protein LOC114728463 [Prosopis alba]